VTRSLRSEHGQSMVVTFMFLAALLAISAAVIDVGAWYRLHRQTQATADAAALAGAQELPEDTGSATTVAVDYGDRNGGGVVSGDVTFEGQVVDADTIHVTARKPAPLIFSKLFGLGDVTARAKAAARSGTPGQARYAAPIGVDIRHPDLQCEPLPCFGNPTTLELDKVGPGAFHLINIDGSSGGINPHTLGEWIERGLDAYMPLAWYHSDPGSKFNSGGVKNALDARIGDELLFPVYRGIRGGGSNFEYEVVGWVGWHLTGYQIGGKGKLFGWFTRVIWEGIQGETATDDDFGVRTISLVE
jgi:hypothetical protein